MFFFGESSVHKSFVNRSSLFYEDVLGVTPDADTVNTIEEEANDVKNLVEAARNGKWDNVWSILGEPTNVKKAYLTNAIPENRRWGVLHQAVYWKKPEVLKKLLQFKAIDTKTKVKKCMSECGPTDAMTALEIADKYGYESMRSILWNHCMSSVYETTIPTFQPYDKYNDNTGLCLLSVTLSSYKQAFHPAPVDPNKSVMNVLCDIFKDLCTNKDRWQKVRDVVADAVYPVSTKESRSISECQCREEFFSQVVSAYTEEHNSIYSFLNMAFRRQKQTDYRPSGDDLAVGPYCVMFQILLLFWKNIEAENRQTYRKMKLSMEDSEQYQLGTKFVWHSIVSSDLKRNHTHVFPTQGTSGPVTVLFTMDNSAACLWQPKNIEELAVYKETERTYPAGAKFIVTKRATDEDGVVCVGLKLLPK